MDRYLCKALGKTTNIESNSTFTLKHLFDVNEWNNIDTITLGKAFSKLVKNNPELKIKAIPTGGTQKYKKL